MTKQTQVQKIVAYADAHETFSMRDIYEKCYINSPTARISDMRKMGYDFEQTKVETEDAWYFSYKIISRPKNKTMGVGV